MKRIVALIFTLIILCAAGPVCAESYELTVDDRSNLIQILPQRGNIMTLRLIKQLQDQLILTDEERVRVDYREEGLQAFWNRAKAEKLTRDFEIGASIRGIVCKQLKIFSDDTNLPAQWLRFHDDVFECDAEEK